MKSTNVLFGLSLILAVMIMGGCATSQPKLTQEQILTQYAQVSSLDSAVKKSRSKGAELLAPESFSMVLDSLESAMDAARNNKKEQANRAAAEGLKLIEKVNRNVDGNRKILSEVLSARERAITAGVITLQAEKFTKLDEDLKATARLIEDGNIESAKQRRPRLFDGYTRLELTALKQGTSDLAKSAIANAKKQGAAEYAPKTLAQAEEEMALAVTILNADRTQTEKADVHAKRARWLAEKSAAITETVKDFDRRDYSMEDVVLWHQSQLQTVNEPLGGQLPFNESSDDVVFGLRNAIVQLKDAEDKSGKQLALTEKERQVLQQQELAQKEKFEKVQAMFNDNEANVYRQRQNVLISAFGFQFPSGQSEIQTENFPLMNKIIRAIKIFPDARIEVIGHTDATGSDKINQAISEARAEKVGKFLSEVGEIAQKRITTRGYGESRPVATNETAEGRAENRRVEIKIINE